MGIETEAPLVYRSTPSQFSWSHIFHAYHHALILLYIRLQQILLITSYGGNVT